MSASSPPVVTKMADIQTVAPLLETEGITQKHTITDKVNHINKRVDTLDTKVHDIEKTLVTPPTPPMALPVSSPPKNNNYDDLFEFL